MKPKHGDNGDAGDRAEQPPPGRLVVELFNDAGEFTDEQVNAIKRMLKRLKRDLGVRCEWFDAERIERGYRRNPEIFG